MSLTDGSMVNCPLMMGGSSMCHMDAFTHIGEWQKLFTALVYSQNLILLIGLLGAVWGTVYLNKDKAFAFEPRPSPVRFNHEYLEEFFSQGILHPKIYS